MATPLVYWAPDVWYAEAPQRFYGVPIGTRMTVVRLRGGVLWLHSPIRIEAELFEALRGLGDVAFLVAPNPLHHLYLTEALDAFPGAELFVTPELVGKRPELPIAGVLSDDPLPIWAGELDQAMLRGSRWMEEAVFLHRTSRTLLVADACQHYGPDSDWRLRAVARALRMYGRPRMPLDWRFTFRNAPLRRECFGRVLGWDFDRLLLAHGQPIWAGAWDLIQREYAWTLR